MELREPPRPNAQSASAGALRGLLLATLVAVLAVGALVYVRTGGSARAESAEQRRELATRLKAAGALDEAAVQYERYLEQADLDPAERTTIAYSVGSTFLESGQPEKALRWFYEAELTDTGELSDELGRKVVHSLERLGRFHAAQSALESRVQLENASTSKVERPTGDPVVARIGKDEIYRSDIERALDELPPELAQSVRTAADRQEFARQYVAEELLWRKARKLEYDRRAEVVRRHEDALRKLAVSRLVEDEVVGKVAVDESDLRNFFQANVERYSQGGAEEAQPDLDAVRPMVERDYRMSKIQAGYQALIESELSAEAVEIYPEKMAEDG